jgi:hypothetical protein
LAALASSVPQVPSGNDEFFPSFQQLNLKKYRISPTLMFLFFAMLAFLKQKKSSLVTGVGSIKNQHEGRGGGPHDKFSKIDAAIDNVEAEQRSVVRRINHLNLEQKEDIGALTAKEEALLEQLRKKEEQLRKKEEQLRAEKLILLERGQHSGPVQCCDC